MVHVLERDHILASLSEYADDCRKGMGRLVLISGEAGVGKTTILDEFAAVTPDARWMRGACDDLSTARPLGPLFDIAAQVGGELATACQRAATREELFAALLAQLTTPGELTVLVIEDIHWADESTLDLVRFLGRRIRDVPAVLLVTYRDDGLAPDHPLRGLLGDLATHRTTRRVSVAPLSEAAVAVLAAKSVVPAAELYRLTGGNPFFVSEVVQAGSREIPPSARDAGLARIAGLSAAARTAVHAAALIGYRVDPRLLNAVAGSTEDVLDRILATGVFVSDDESLRFRHEITRVAVEQQVPAHRRRPMHARVLEALRAAGCEDDARLAHHAEGADDRAAVLAHAPRAGRRASGLASHREAAAQFERALRFADGADPTFRADLYDRLAVEVSLLDRWQEAADAGEQALSLWRQVGDPVREGDVLRRLSKTMWRICQAKDAYGFADAAIAILEPEGDTPELAWAYSNLASQHMVRADNEAGIATAVRARRLAERLGMPDALSDALNTEACCAANQGGEWEEDLRRALDVALVSGADDQAGRAYANLCANFMQFKRFAEAEAVIDEGTPYCEEHDIRTFSLCLDGSHVEVLFWTGRWDEAVELGRRMLSGNASPINRLCPCVNVGTILGRRGDASAWALLDEAIESAIGSNEADRIALTRLARVELLWLEDRAAEALVELEACQEFASECDEWIRGSFATWLRRTGSELTVATDGVAEPDALLLAGDFAAAERAWARIGCPYEAALALLDSGEESAVREALRRFDLLGATAAVQAARRTMRKLGIRSIPVGARATTRSNPLGLTNREREVLELICSGRTNADIAGELYISAKTVDHHVSAVLAKLAVSSRGAAATEAVRLGLVPAGPR